MGSVTVFVVTMDPSLPLLCAMALSLILLQVNQRIASPILAIANRWLRWVIFAFGMGYVLSDFQVINRPYWVLVLMCFLLWFLLETVYNWMAISALSLSPLPLFPAYASNPGGDEWPMQKRLLDARDWLRKNHFKHVQSLRAEIGGGVYLRVSIYEEAQAKIRMQLMFVPQPSGSVSMSAVVTSLTEDGRRIVTDNLHIPFGGFYPESWYVERLPWTRSLPALLTRHRARVADAKLITFEKDPLSDIEYSQRDLDRLNTEMGFLYPSHEREENGKITHEGRYRVWKEVWMLDYLGRCSRYC